MASSRPDDSSTAQTPTQASDTIWRARLEDAEDTLIGGLRLYSDTIVKLCTKKDIIRDDDIKAFKQFKPERRIREIIYLVSRGDRQTYEQFREILRQAGHDDFYKQLEITEDDDPEQCSDEASPRPTSTPQNKESDDIWKEWLKDKEEALVIGLRRYPSAILNKLIAAKMIKDVDILEMKKIVSPEKKVRKIILLVLQGNRETYEKFRNILKGCKLTALYDLLEIKKAEPGQVSGKGDYDELIQEIRMNAKKSNDDRKKILEAVEKCSDEASPRPTSTPQNKESDDIWKEWLKDKEEALVIGLRLYPSAILNKLIAAKMIKDVDILEMKKIVSPEKKVRKIILLVLQGNRETYEKFRNILKGCKLTALYDLLEIKKAEPGQVSGKGDYDELIQEIRMNAKKSNDDRKKILEAVEKVERIQAEEIKRLRSSEEQKQQECNCVEKTIKELKSQIAKMKEALKQNKGSRHEIEQLQTELNEKQKAFEALKQAVADLRKKIHAMRLDFGSDNLESVR